MASGSSGLQEVIVLFDATGTEVASEMGFSEFQRLLRHQAALADHADRMVKAVYVMVGAGLAVRGLAFFLFKTNDQGYLDPAFNLPLEYMVRNAGEGPDLGMGSVRLACRSQCPVPWHAVNLWQPEGEGDAHPAQRVQRAIWRNRLGLKPLPTGGAIERLPELQPRHRHEAALTLEGDWRASTAASAAAKLTATFGEAGRLSPRQYAEHRTQTTSRAPERAPRGQLDRSQQQSYLDQIRACRDEIQQLKAALRHEQARNRRLQELLRGGV